MKVSSSSRAITYIPKLQVTNNPTVPTTRHASKPSCVGVPRSASPTDQTDSHPSNPILHPTIHTIPSDPAPTRFVLYIFNRLIAIRSSIPQPPPLVSISPGLTATGEALPPSHRNKHTNKQATNNPHNPEPRTEPNGTGNNSFMHHAGVLQPSRLA